MNFRKTKIVAKIADNKSEIDFLKTLKNAGADVWWINTAHQEEAESLEVIKRMREVSTDMPILLDTKGPEVRTKNVENPINVKTGDFITFTGDLSVTGENIVNVTYPNFANEVPVGEVVLYDDASVGLEVVEKTDKGIKCIVKNDGVIKNKKSLNIPNVHIELPALTEKDQRFVHFCAKNGVDYVIHSFVRNKADIFEIKDILKNYQEYKGKIIAKIEKIKDTQKGRTNMDKSIKIEVKNLIYFYF
jgi:pyruvate kinase